MKSLYSHHSGAGKGALIGSTLGFAFGALVGISFCADTDAACSPVAIGLGVGLGLGIVGMGPGALIGSSFSKWQYVYPAKALINVKNYELGLNIPAVLRTRDPIIATNTSYEVHVVRIIF